MITKNDYTVLLFAFNIELPETDRNRQTNTDRNKQKKTETDRNSQVYPKLAKLIQF